ncbi:hypothetical protein SJ05684_c34620 [Sinorhizobium sojae CCBAU 05684]|uniref:3-oxoacyl-[acyl-carrier protein] reductase n=1 Tax=Sinorhizobium sojae CCBAU 05684 TaxID=716928 RepID=A0A249PG41_9HYPH|nr:hypothetical protein [Sinorhizobium sojae]ASY64878.1 hypothetical protein SJ05684_c34620 [Sinorhizobium sojae CCBAU 05684]
MDSASGIGAAIAKRFVEQGAKAVIADLNLEAARVKADGPMSDRERQSALPWM